MLSGKKGKKGQKEKEKKRENEGKKSSISTIPSFIDIGDHQWRRKKRQKKTTHNAVNRYGLCGRQERERERGKELSFNVLNNN